MRKARQRYPDLLAISQGEFDAAVQFYSRCTPAKKVTFEMRKSSAVIQHQIRHWHELRSGAPCEVSQDAAIIAALALEIPVADDAAGRTYIGIEQESIESLFVRTGDARKARGCVEVTALR